MKCNPHRRAFTLVEVLVCLAIITILMSILLPAAEHVRHQGYIDKCASNLRQIGLALSMYANDNAGNYPRTRYTPDGPLVMGTGIAAPDPFRTPPAGVTPVAANDLTAPLFLLMKAEQLPPALMICPYNDATSYVPDQSPTVAFRSNFTDWTKNLGYSFANPYPSTAAAMTGYRLSNKLRADFALAADLSPGVDTREDDVFAPTLASPSAVMAKSNSNNHEKDGQNVLFGDGHVQWCKTPFVGIASDNIYTAQVRTPAGVYASPTDATDSLLLPTDND